jgi:hypothetical protein
VRPPFHPWQVPIFPAYPRLLHDWAVARRPFLPARLPDLSPDAMADFRRGENFLRFLSLTKEISSQRYRCARWTAYASDVGRMARPTSGRRRKKVWVGACRTMEALAVH